jgi:hypothetical protein
MESDVYTLGVWRVTPGNQEKFILEWKGLGAYFGGLQNPPGPGTLVQSVQDDTLFYSFGPWQSLDDIQAMRADPNTPGQIARLAALCDEATPGAYKVVART